MVDIVIRLEEEADYRSVEEITREAFWNVYQQGADEHFLLNKMRAHPDFVKELDFVAEHNGKIVGSIVYTKAKILLAESGEAFSVLTFGPLSVSPEFKGQGIGTKLVKHSTVFARELGFPAVVIYGDPRFYGRCGFRSGEKYDITNAKGQFCYALQALQLQPNALLGINGVFEESKLFSEITTEDVEAFDATFPPKVKEVTESKKLHKVMVSLKFKAID